MLRRNISGRAFYTDGIGRGCGKLATSPESHESGVFRLYALAGGNLFPHLAFILDRRASLRGGSVGILSDARQERGPPMRVFAVQQLAFFATAAAILFVGAIIVGLI